MIWEIITSKNVSCNDEEFVGVHHGIGFFVIDAMGRSEYKIVTDYGSTTQEFLPVFASPLSRLVETGVPREITYLYLVFAKN